MKKASSGKGNKEPGTESDFLIKKGHTPLGIMDSDAYSKPDSRS